MIYTFIFWVRDGDARGREGIPGWGRGGGDPKRRELGSGVGRGGAGGAGAAVAAG